jgi:hypothetical protein
MLLEIPSGSGQAVATLDLTPPDDVVRAGIADANLRLMFTKSNRVIVQDVSVIRFSEKVAPSVMINLLENIEESLRQKWEQSPVFKVVTARLTCIPDSGCRFTWLRVSFELGDDAEDGIRPIACKLFPESSQDAVKLKSNVEVSGELSVAVVKTGMKIQKGFEHDRFEYNVNAYGAFSSSPTWDFQKTPVHPQITGDLVLLMVIALAGDESNSGQLKVSARAELGDGSIAIPLITRRTEDNAATVQFNI